MNGPDDAEPPVRVGIGIVGRLGRYLVRRRPVGSPMPGVWEFPGGKCEPGESPEDATRRECREEIGLEVRVGPLRRRFTYRYPHAFVELSYYDCTTEDPHAEPQPETGFCWVRGVDLPGMPFPDANEPVLRELAGERP